MTFGPNIVGFPGVETQMPLTADPSSRRRLSLSRVLLLASTNPARRTAYPAKGALLPGSDADITLIDLDREETIERIASIPRSKITPFEGTKAPVWPMHTLVPAFRHERIGIWSARAKLGASVSSESIACRRHSPRTVNQTLAAVTRGAWRGK